MSSREQQAKDVKGRLHELVAAERAKEIVGCDYTAGFAALGYSHVCPIDMTSSAGDWTFVVSTQGLLWQLGWQTNNYPKPGYTYSVGAEWACIGRKEDAVTGAEAYLSSTL